MRTAKCLPRAAAVPSSPRSDAQAVPSWVPRVSAGAPRSQPAGTPGLPPSEGRLVKLCFLVPTRCTCQLVRGAGKDALYISETPSPVLLLQSRVPLRMCSQPLLLLLGGLRLLAAVWGHSNARGLLGLQQQLARPRLAEWGFFSPFNKREPVHSTGVIVLGLSCEEWGCTNISCLGARARGNAEQGSLPLGCPSCCSCC